MLHYAWFISCVALLAVWAVVYWSSRMRREMLIASLLTMPFGLTEPLFVPEYWNPPSLFDLAQTTQFDIESLLFSFAVGGLGLVLYDLILRTRPAPVSQYERSKPRHRFHKLAVISPFLAFSLLALATDWGFIYIGSLAMLIGGVATIACRPDLAGRTLLGGLLFLGMYCGFFQLVNLAFPSFVKTAWNLEALSGLMVTGIPAEELLFAFTFGLMWAGFYHHITWHRTVH
ncbi:MAG: hypothetical protein GTN69_11945 [Armatimonadetes bacterium]|nr:hypothetical protein [Armatimonadota bacterium]